MANEISLSVSLTASKGGAAVSINGAKTLDMAGTDMTSETQTFGTTEQPVPLGDVAQGGLVVIKNLSTTESIRFGLTGFTYAAAVWGVGPGETIMVRTNSGSAAIFGIASADSTLAQCVILEP